MHFLGQELRLAGKKVSNLFMMQVSGIRGWFLGCYDAVVSLYDRSPKRRCSDSAVRAGLYGRSLKRRKCSRRSPHRRQPAKLAS